MDTMRQRILVVDDDPSLAEMLTIVLRGEGFDTAVIGDGTQALTAVRELRPDLVLLDLMLPGMNGIDVCRVLRAESGVPIVMLTAKGDTVDVVLGLESGADDYIMKPFKSKELVARVRARLRRTDEPAPEMLQIGDILIDVAGHSVKRNGETLSLTPLEFDLLVALARKPRQVFTREVLLEQGWGYPHAWATRRDLADRRMEQRSAERGQRDQPDVREAWEMALRRKKWVRWIVSWLPHRLTITIRTLLRWQHLVIAKIRHRWRRSLQLRVVGTTLVISATMIAVLGFFLTEQIADGLLHNAENSDPA